MSKYIRKTLDEYQIHGDYGYGWEEVCCGEDYKDARRLLREYNENEPQYPHKIVKKRIKRMSMDQVNAVLDTIDPDEWSNW